MTKTGGHIIRILVTTSAIALGYATQADAQDFETRLVNAFVRDGFSKIEVTTRNGQAKVEAVRDGMEEDTVYDVKSGAVLSHEVAAWDGDDRSEHGAGHDGPQCFHQSALPTPRRRG